MRTAALLLSLLAIAALASHTAAQVAVTTAPAGGPLPGDIVMDCPLQVDIPLSAASTPIKMSFKDAAVKKPWFSSAMANYVCHTERVARVVVQKFYEKRGRTKFSVMATIKSDQWRQDVDLDFTILGRDGRSLCSRRIDNLTVGKDRVVSGGMTFASSTKHPKIECDVDAGRFKSEFGDDGSAPVLRIVLKPEMDDEDED